MHLGLSHSTSQPRPLRPPRSLRSCLARPPKPQSPKKQVVFADTAGLSLTSVLVFEDAVGGDSEEGPCRCQTDSFAFQMERPLDPRALRALSGSASP
ncbi:protein phosphatase 1 regulatory subunit 3C-like [Leopardus geoffroyi]|uniref:protein phosphatase 1 regulatory subunit 3C-like n=1 Tax=Leopardus geoffroyi TaxID=46844 RepID=UPI001E25DB38|nr:protein phosphatase 1 regulatory subunit 3C-like [Leopardus geoffroyi]